MISPDPEDRIQISRRKVLSGIVKLLGAFGVLAAAIPFLRSLLDFGGASPGLDVNVSDLPPGGMKVVDWLGRRVAIYRRTARAVATLDTSTDGYLKDPESMESRQPGFARNSYRSRRPEFFVAYANCTHLGCEISATDGSLDPRVGFECPCHQSRYDHAGRVLKGQPAPLNLAVPSYRHVSGDTIRLLPG